MFYIQVIFFKLFSSFRFQEARPRRTIENTSGGANAKIVRSCFWAEVIPYFAVSILFTYFFNINKFLYKKFTQNSSFNNQNKSKTQQTPHQQPNTQIERQQTTRCFRLFLLYLLRTVHETQGTHITTADTENYHKNNISPVASHES